MRKSHQGRPVSSISHPVVEPLESRQLLSASLIKGVIKVNGTAGDDVIAVGLKGNTQIRVTDSAGSKLFARSKVKSISINAGDGNDTINVGNGLKQWVNINGGNGNDTVHGGNGREIISGGAGADSLFGGDGSDWISGGDGNDTISGDAGNDYLYGDAGDDHIDGGAGNDVLAGDLENTLVSSGVPAAVQGNDSLNGGDGNDTLLCERHILGVDGAGNWIFETDGSDTLTGGNGNDVLDIGAPDVDGHQDDVITDKSAGDFVPMNDARPFSENGTTDVHTHVLLQIKVKKGSKYRNMLVQPNIGFFAPHFLSGLHTHDTSGVIHFEAPAGTPNYKLGEFFRNWGITLDSGAIGRFLAPVGKKVTMTITHGSTSTLNGKLGNYVPRGVASTDVAHAGGDVITLKVG